MLGQSSPPRVPGEIVPSPTWGALGIPGAGVVVEASLRCWYGGTLRRGGPSVGTATEAFADLI